MPLVAEARVKDSDAEYALVDISEYAQPKDDLSGLEFRCPECKSAMHIRHTMLVMAHFAHNPGQDRECSLSEHGGETILHLTAKIRLHEELRELPLYRGAKFRKEHWLPEVKRRADLFVEFADGSFEVHEIQLASTTNEELEARTNDYRLAGADEVIWWFGKSADTQAHRAWAKEKIGG